MYPKEAWLALVGMESRTEQQQLQINLQKLGCEE